MGFGSTHQLSSRVLQVQRSPARAKNLTRTQDMADGISYASRVYLRRSNIKVHGTRFSYTLDQSMQVSVVPTELH